MSVSLSIYWPDGNFEDVGIASQRGAQRWADLARATGLELVPHFHGFLAVDLRNLDQLLAEMHAFRHALLSAGSEAHIDLEAVDRLIAALERLKLEVGWRASIG